MMGVWGSEALKQYGMDLRPATAMHLVVKGSSDAEKIRASGCGNRDPPSRLKTCCRELGQVGIYEGLHPHSREADCAGAFWRVVMAILKYHSPTTIRAARHLNF